ncbi:MAG TPA: lytic transglycosylase domain-containing protein [Burkholderiaceae bacterium]|nr:lytic transglycosylase domain-containing protein [Burkholderiaceae bacterium]
MPPSTPTPTPHPPLRRGGPRRATRAFVWAGVATAMLAWVRPADPPPAPPSQPVLSYQAMASRLVELYPASRDHAGEIVRTVHREADRHRLDPCLVMGVIARESSFAPQARNSRDLGLMQVNPRYHPDLVERAGGPRAMLEPARNIAAGTEVLARYRRASGDDLEALQRYHGLGKRNDYVERVAGEARRLRDAGVCVGGDVTVAAR